MKLKPQSDNNKKILEEWDEDARLRNQLREQQRIKLKELLGK